MRSLDRIFRRNKPNLKTLAQWVKSLFSTGVNGAWYDPSDINLTWRRNLLTYTEQFDNAAWVKGGISTQANIAAAPDGSLTADSIIESAAAGAHRTVRSLTTATDSVYTLSVYAKLASGVRNVGLKIWDGGAVDRGNAFNLSTQTISTILGYSSADTASIVYVGSGWYRCSITVTSGASATGDISIMLVNGNLDSYTGDGYSGIYIWGAQLELGSTATPYQRITDGIKDYLDYKPLPILYQDAAGTTPVTAVGQPVGLMLDKSKGLVLGPELLPNGDFATSSGWSTTNGVTIANGEAVFSSVTNGSSLYAAANLATTPGVWYQLQFTIKSRNAGSIGLRLASTGGNTPRSYSDPGTYVYRLAVGTASPSNTYVVFDASGFSGVVDDVSVKAIPGNHAFNASGNSANFPVLSSRYNVLNNTETLANQSVTTRAAKYILSFWGTGSVALSGTYTGTLAGTSTDNRVYVEFTATAGTLTLTVTGSVLKAQLEEL